MSEADSHSTGEKNSSQVGGRGACSWGPRWCGGEQSGLGLRYSDDARFLDDGCYGSKMTKMEVFEMAVRCHQCSNEMDDSGLLVVEPTESLTLFCNFSVFLN